MHLAELAEKEDFKVVFPVLQKDEDQASDTCE